MSEDLNDFGSLVPKHLCEALLEENTRLKAEIQAIKEKMDKLPTRQIGDKWYTEGQFQQLIQDARYLGL